MWVTVDKQYAGPLGFFPGGQKHDLTRDIIAGLRDKLGKENVVDTCAPWDEHKDHKTAAQAELKGKAYVVIEKVKWLQARIAELRKIAAELNVRKKELDDAVPKAKQLAKAAGIPWPPQNDSAGISGGNGEAVGNAKG
jgi:hypothetical protein